VNKSLSRDDRRQAEAVRNRALHRLFLRYDARARAEAAAAEAWRAAGEPDLDALPSSVRERGRQIDAAAVRARISEETFITELAARVEHARRKQAKRRTAREADAGVAVS
jgi:hypothetical protein